MTDSLSTLFEGKDELKKAFANLSVAIKSNSTAIDYLALIEKYSFDYYKMIAQDHGKINDVIRHILYRTNAAEFKKFFAKISHDLDHIEMLGNVLKDALSNNYNISDKQEKLAIITDFFHSEMHKLLINKETAVTAEMQDPEYQERMRIIKQAEGRIIIKKSP
jgi:esterase/lipase